MVMPRFQSGGPAGDARGNARAPAPDSAGKGTLVGAGPDGAAAAAPHTPGVRPPTPPEFAAMDADLVEKLWSSRVKLSFERAAFKDKPDDQFWDAVRGIGAADLHTLSVVCVGAKGVGVWPHVQTITGWYTYGSSYAIEFLGDPHTVTGSGAWGKDFPQKLVQDEHNHTKHEWYRHNSGAGSPGMHLGIDVGAAYNNIHWDPTNPMDHVGDGMPHVSIVPGVPFPVPSFEPKGQAIYSPGALAAHAAEIGFFGEGAKGLVKKPESPTEKFLHISSAKDSADKTNQYADMEASAPDRTDMARSAAIVADIRRTAAAVLALHKTAQSAALLPDAGASAQLDDLVKQIEPARTALWAPLAALITFMKLEAAVEGTSAFDTEAQWAAAETWKAYDWIVDLQRRRTMTKLTKKK